MENDYGEPPFHFATASGHLKKSQAENISPKTNCGEPPLHSAAIIGQMENINHENNHVEPPLHSAATSGHLKNSKPQKDSPEHQSVKTSGTFEFNFVNASKITKKISNLKNSKALGLDNISTEVWKKGKITLSGPIAHFVQCQYGNRYLP